MKYRCNLCGGIVDRASRKLVLESFCMRTGRKSKLHRIMPKKKKKKSRKGY